MKKLKTYQELFEVVAALTKAAANLHPKPPVDPEQIDVEALQLSSVIADTAASVAELAEKRLPKGLPLKNRQRRKARQRTP